MTSQGHDEPCATGDDRLSQVLGNLGGLLPWRIEVVENQERRFREVRPQRGRQ